MNNVVIEKEMGFSDPVFISGLTRSGKILLCKVVAALKNCEKVNVDFFWEQVPFLNYIEKIPDDGAVYLLQAGLNIKIYDNAIGRNTNFRTDDYTSIWQYQNPAEYLERLSKPDGDSVFQNLHNSERIFSMMVHNGLWHSELLFKAFPKMKMFHMQRNPVDIVFSWIKKGYGGEFYNNARSSCLSYKFKDHVVPYYAYGWEQEYLKHESVDRIIFMIKTIREKHLETYQRLSESQKKQILFVDHRKLAESPEVILPKVCSFLNTTKSDMTDIMLKRDDCPRTFPPNDVQIKKDKIQSECSAEAFAALLAMENEFGSQEIFI